MSDRIDPANRDAGGSRHRLVPAVLRLLLRRSDVHGRACDVNDAWVDWTGRARERSLGDGWLDDVHPEDRARCASIQRTMSEVRQPYALDYRLRHGAGGHRWMMEQAEPQCRVDGEFDGYLHHSVDVDERTRQANELAARASTMRQALRHQTNFAAALARDLHVLPLQAAAEALAAMARLGRGSSALDVGRWPLDNWLRSAVDAAAAGQPGCPAMAVTVPAWLSIDIDRPLLDAALALLLGDAARHSPQAFEQGIQGWRDGDRVRVDLPGRDGGSPSALLACAIELLGGELMPLPGAARVRLTLPLADGD